MCYAWFDQPVTPNIHFPIKGSVNNRHLRTYKLKNSHSLYEQTLPGFTEHFLFWDLKKTLKKVNIFLSWQLAGYRLSDQFHLLIRKDQRVNIFHKVTLTNILPNPNFSFQTANIHFGGKTHKRWREDFTSRQYWWETETTAQTGNEVTSENSSVFSCTFTPTKTRYV